MVLWSRGVALFVLAVWLGAAVFLTVGAGPAFFSPAMMEIVPRETAGRIAQLVLSRYFILIQVCGWLGLILWGLEFAATPASSRQRPLRRRGALLGILLGLAMAGGLWLQPHLKSLNQIRYASESSEAVREAARRQFGAWHGVSQTMNLVLLAGVGVALWKTARQERPRPEAERVR
jgi:hypothetical protein